MRRERPSSVQDKVGGQRELIGCKGQFQFGASGTLGKWSRNRLHRAAFLSQTSTCGRYVEVGRSSDEARETSTFSGNRNIRSAEGGASSNAASKAAYFGGPHPVISHDTETR